MTSAPERLAAELALLPDASRELLDWLERQQSLRRAASLTVVFETDDHGRLHAVYVPKRYTRMRKIPTPGGNGP